LSNGDVVTGANVENASYGLTLCAECMIVSLAATQGMRITAIAIVNGSGEVITPCGRCRQLLAEHASADFRLLTAVGAIDLHGMLPLAFSATELTGAGTTCGDDA
jgi:cytidine deaminase